MRQILFYISVDAPFSILPEGTAAAPILHIGMGLILIAMMLAYSAWFFLSGQNQKQTPVNDKGSQKAKQKPVAGSQANLQPLFWTLGQLVVLGVVVYFVVPLRIFPVFGYGTMLLVALVVGASWAGRRADQVGIKREVVWDASMSILIAGIVGARTFYLVQKREDVFAGAHTLKDSLIRIVNLSDGGLVLYGGVILGTIVYFSFCALRKIRPLQLADVITPSIFLGIGFGRIGCLLNGCCFGDRCELPWAITFPQGSVPFRVLVDLGFLDPSAVASFPLHPTQIYSTIGCFVLAYLTATVFKYRRHVGEVFAVGAIFYPINRFLIEFVRADEFTQMNTGLTISQLVSIGVLIAGVAYLAYLETTGLPKSVKKPAA
ncbi:MAG: prolipoprotein diacylglyceryl transferase [Planctomycetaceae bacterium]|nr:prolipoprotein diacylglyceryl transferase [Planctomycetaceae bacterium]